MPYGKGTYGRKAGRPKKRKGNKKMRPKVKRKRGK